MKYFSSVCVASAFAGLVVVLGGCGSGGSSSNRGSSLSSSSKGSVIADATLSPSPTPDGPVSTSRSYGNLIFTLTAPKRVYAVSETVPLTFTVQNTGTTDASSIFTFNATDGEVTTQNGEAITPLFNPGPFNLGNAHTGPLQLVYPAGQTVSFTLRWTQNQKGYAQADKQVTPGIYRIRAFVAVDNLDGVDVPTHALGTDFLEVEVR